MSGRTFHDFYAPIDGTALRFQMLCVDGAPKAVLPVQPLRPVLGRRRMQALNAQLDLLEVLLKDLPWPALAGCIGRGNLGAIIEAAEARRAEIYGAARA